MSASTNPCPHSRLRIKPHPSQSQYSWPSPNHRAAATTPLGIVKESISDSCLHGLESDIFASTFLGPLVLPNDDLALDPKYPAQSLRSWIRAYEKERIGDGGRNVLYVVGPPRVHGESGSDFMSGWTNCDVTGSGKGRGVKSKRIGKEDDSGISVEDVAEYLGAFYHGFKVQFLDPSLLSFTPWTSSFSPDQTNSKSRSKLKPQKSTQPSYIGLRTNEEIIATRHRATSGPYKHQLNLNGLLDVAISTLPGDAYALLMLVDHDLYEDDDDEFVCGRAYGGSRVAVVSSARYNPILDELQGVSREHAWPASCCDGYAEACCERGKKRKRGRKADEEQEDELAVEGSPLKAAVIRHASLPLLGKDPAPSALRGLWLSRICRTASHEVGHCFVIDHCVYYTCCMQGSASITEDARQTPYLCPVDLQKVVRTTGANVEERYRALMGFCEKHGGVHMFGAFGEWIKGRLEQMKGMKNKQIYLQKE